jgi:type IV pilus assembly protein PilN
MLMNLLPHRAWAQARQRKKLATGLAAAALLGLACAALAGVWFDRQISALQAANSRLKQDIAGVDGQLQEIVQLQENMRKLTLQTSALQAFQSERERPARWLNEVLDHLPDGLYLTALNQDGDKVTLNGVARSDEQIFALLRNLASRGRWLAQAELTEVTAAPVSLNPLVPPGTPFALRALLQRPAETAAATVSELAAQCLARTAAGGQSRC